MISVQVLSSPPSFSSVKHFVHFAGCPVCFGVCLIPRVFLMTVPVCVSVCTRLCVDLMTIPFCFSVSSGPGVVRPSGWWTEFV